MSGSPCMFPAQHDGECVCALVGTQPAVTAAPGPQQPDEVRVLVDALAGVVASANTGMVNGDDGFVESYNVMPGPIHRAIALLARRGVVVSLDGQIHHSPAAPSAQPDRSLSQQRRLAVQDPDQPDEVRCTRCDEHPAMHAAAPPARSDRLHAPGPGSSLTGYLPQCWCQEKDDVWPCPSAQPDRVTGQGAAR